MTESDDKPTQIEKRLAIGQLRRKDEEWRLYYVEGGLKDPDNGENYYVLKTEYDGDRIGFIVPNEFLDDEQDKYLGCQRVDDLSFRRREKIKGTPELFSYQNLVKGIENDYLEYKRELPQDNEKIEKEVKALLNSISDSQIKYGYLIVGYCEEDGAVGVKNPDNVEERLSNICADRVDNNISMTGYVPENKVLVCRFSESENAPYSMNGKIPKKVGSIISWEDMNK